jgi:hypothetical protein
MVALVEASVELQSSGQRYQEMGVERSSHKIFGTFIPPLCDWHYPWVHSFERKTQEGCS